MKSLRRAHTALFALLSLALYVQCSGTTASPSAGGTYCATLSSCCTSATLPAADLSRCLQVVGDAVDSECLASLSSYTSASYCTVSTAHGLDAGTQTTDTGTSESTACTLLATCCTSAGFIPSDVSACLADADSNNATTCASALASYHSAGVCTSVATAPDSGTGPGIDAGTGPGIDSGTGPGIDSGTGGSCPANCSLDSDCSATCPPQADVTYCCDGATHACYETSTFSCPVTIADAGIDTGVY